MRCSAKNRARARRSAFAALAALALPAAPAAAQEFGVYLDCKGELLAQGKRRPATLDLALRRNSQLAMISASSVLPAAQKLVLQITPRFYTMTHVVPSSSQAWYDWYHGELVVWSPHLRNLHAIRLSVDRQTAALEGDLRDGTGASLGQLAMKCTPHDNETVEAPKF